MATSPLSSAVSPSTADAHDFGSVCGDLKSSFLQCTKLFSAPEPERNEVRRGFRAPSPKASFDPIPKQFRQENLEDGYLPAVAELLVAQFMWLDFDNPTKPIYLYINSTGTVNEKMKTVGSESEAFAIADSMLYLSFNPPKYCKSDVYTVNCVVWRMVKRQCFYLLEPRVTMVYGQTPPAKELVAISEYYIELLAKGTGKTIEEIREDVQRPKYLQAQEAIEYGLADKIISSMDPAYEKQNYDEMRAMRRGAVASPQSAPSGFK